MHSYTDKHKVGVFTCCWTGTCWVEPVGWTGTVVWRGTVEAESAPASGVCMAPEGHKESTILDDGLNPIKNYNVSL